MAILVFYFILQLNFDLISHNFGARFFHFFNSNLFFVLGLVAVTPPLLWIYYGFHRMSKNMTLIASAGNSVLPKYFSRTYPVLLPYATLSLWVFYSLFDFIEASNSLFLSFIVLVDRVYFRDLNCVLLVILMAYFHVRRVRTKHYSQVISAPLLLIPYLLNF